MDLWWVSSLYLLEASCILRKVNPECRFVAHQHWREAGGDTAIELMAQSGTFLSYHRWHSEHLRGRFGAGSCRGARFERQALDDAQPPFGLHWNLLPLFTHSGLSRNEISHTSQRISSGRNRLIADCGLSFFGVLIIRRW